MKLIYFDGRGIVEPARLMLALARQSYTDDRIAMDAVTGDSPDFDARQASGEFTANMTALPILLVDGVALGQSKTINRYLARRLGFLGSNELEAAQIDCIAEHVDEMTARYAAFTSGKADGDLAAARQSFDFAWHLRAIEQCLQANAGYAVGTRRSLADVIIFHFLRDSRYPFPNDEQVCTNLAAALPTYPKLAAIVASVSADAKEYLESRPASTW